MVAHKNAGKTVKEILKAKQARVKNAALGSDILEVGWEEIVERARRCEPGYRTIKKLLEKSEYDK